MSPCIHFAVWVILDVLLFKLTDLEDIIFPGWKSPKHCTKMSKYWAMNPPCMLFPISNISLLQALCLLRICLHAQQIAFLIRSVLQGPGQESKEFFKEAQRTVTGTGRGSFLSVFLCFTQRAKSCSPYLVLTYSKSSLTSRVGFA